MNLEDYLLIFVGDCQAGGYVPLKYAPPEVRRIYPNIEIYNNKSKKFETLRVGVNSLLLHDGLPNNAFIGWEAALGCKIKDTPVHIVKCGNGITCTAFHWMMGGQRRHYLETYKERVTHAISLRPELKTVVWFSQGLNDVVVFSPEEFFPLMVGAIANIQSRLSNKQVIIPTLPPKFAAHNRAIMALADNEDIFVVDGNTYFWDERHWGWVGLLDMVERLYIPTVEKWERAARIRDGL